MKSFVGITIRELRQLLFGIKNQDMTIRELRQLLFDEEDQEFKLDHITRRKLGLY